MTRMMLGALSACATVACHARPPPSGPSWQGVMQVPVERPICGWEEVADGTAILRLGSAGASAPPGQSAVVIAPRPETDYAAVQRALVPAEHTLVRVKLAIDDRWLLSTTYPQKRRQPPKPPPGQRATRIVGHRQITRDVRRPAERFAALRIDGERVMLFVENERQEPELLSVSGLNRALMAIVPPAQVFAVTATADTPWAIVERVIIAAACFDRMPGDEPHEIIVD